MYRRKRDLHCEYLPGYVRLDNQPFERDRLIGIRFVLNFVKFISFTFGDKEMISVIEAIIREVFVKLLLDSFGKLSIRVDVRTYLLGGAIDSSEANGIIRDPKLELENSRFTFDLVPLSYESVDVVVGENWLLRHKAEMVCHEKVVKMPCVPKELVGFTPRRRIGFRMELVQGATPICEGSCRLTSLERKEVWNDCRSCKVRVGSNGNLLWKAPVLLGRKKGCVMDTLKFTAMPFGLTNAPAVFMELMSRRKLSRCGRNQMGNEPILALPEGADDFVVYYDARSKDLEACLEKGRRLSNRWLSMKKDVASCGSKYLAYSEVEVEYQGSSGLLLQPELPK
ncbi:putative reverse transcriptase domain-containing protein [Tanacetum coccineum]